MFAAASLDAAFFGLAPSVGAWASAADVKRKVERATGRISGIRNRLFMGVRLREMSAAGLRRSSSDRKLGEREQEQVQGLGLERELERALVPALVPADG